MSISFSANKNGIPQGNIPAFGPDVQVTMPFTDWNDGGYYDTTLSRWTPPVGHYRLSVHFGNDGTNVNTGDYFHLWLYKNGVRFKAIAIVRAVESNASVYAGGSIIVEANGTDYFELWTSMNGTSGTNLNNNGIARDHYWQGSSI
jgi:hypothetical protein